MVDDDVPLAPAEPDEPVESEHPEVANVPAERKQDIEHARLIGRVLSLAAQRLGLPCDKDLRPVCDGIIGAARDGRADPLEYRIAYWLRFGGSFGLERA
jgi:hypothetical protein